MRHPGPGAIVGDQTKSFYCKGLFGPPCSRAGPLNQRSDSMSEQKSGVDMRRRGDDRAGARRRRPVRPGLRRRHVQHRGLSRARRHQCRPSPPRWATIPIPTACWRSPPPKASRANLMLRVPGRLPGLCLIETGPSGERKLPLLARHLAGARTVRTAGLDIVSPRACCRRGSSISPASRCRSIPTSASAASSPCSKLARQQGVKVAFDGNFRPRGWKGDLARTRTVFIEALKRVDIALPTFEDEAMLWGDPSPEATVERLQAFGIGEIVVKNGRTARWSRRRAAGVRAGAGGGRAGRHHGGGRQLQRRLSRGAARGRGAGERRRRRASASPAK